MINKHLIGALAMAEMAQAMFPEKNRYTYKRDSDKIGRNDPCYCGSGKKYKKCCLSK